MSTQPTPEQFQTLFEKAPPGPLIMLNLLKFKDKAEYADGRETDMSGIEAYAIYGSYMKKRLEADGGRFIFSADTHLLVIGDGDLEWDAVGIVEYASLESFKEIVFSAEYLDVSVHREAGLEHQLLINCTGGDL
ncbi:MAG: DUF1330 domain-containing protein [Thermodesulfobacteriota bacterium]